MRGPAIVLLVLSLGLAAAAKPARRPAPKPAPAKPAHRNTAPAGETPLERALQAELEALLARKALAGTTTSLVVVDAASGRELFAAGGDRQLKLASNSKLIATAAAFEALGAAYAYETRLLGPAPDEDGVVHGDVHLHGAHDPMLTAQQLSGLGAALAAAGVRRVEGDILVGDDQRDGPGHAALEINVEGTKDGDKPYVSLSPALPYFSLAVTARTSAKAKKKTRAGVALEIIDDAKGPRVRVVVSGRLRPKRIQTFTRAVPRAALFAGHLVRAGALKAGVEISGGVRRGPDAGDDAVVLAAHRSAPLAELAARINKPSNNFLADRLTATLGAELLGGEDSLKHGVEGMRRWLRDVGVSGGYFLENGSGLSHQNRMSARQIVRVLLAGAAEPETGAAFLASLSVGGVDGTLRARFAGRPSRGHLRGKTGTLSGVATLAGFVDSEGGGRLCFSLMTNDFKRKRKDAIRETHADMVDAMLAHLRAVDRLAAATQPAPTSAPASQPAEPTTQPTSLPAGDEDAPAPDDDALPADSERDDG